MLRPILRQFFLRTRKSSRWETKYSPVTTQESFKHQLGEIIVICRALWLNVLLPESNAK